MDQEIKTVMVLGGRGNGGTRMIASLVKAGLQVSVLSRASPTDQATTFQGLPLVRSDYSLASLVDVFRGQDAVVCAIPTSDIASQKTMIDAAAAAGVKRFVPGEFGSDTEVELDDKVEFLRSKKEIVGYLRTKEAGGMSWTGLITGPWIDWMLLEGKGLLGIDIRAKTATIFDSGDVPFVGSTMSLVADALAAVLLHHHETRNQYVHVCSLRLTQNALLASLERVSGSKLAVSHRTVAEEFAAGRENVEGGDWAVGYYQLVNTLTYGGSTVNRFEGKTGRWMGVLGLEGERDVDGVMREVLAKVVG